MARSPKPLRKPRRPAERLCGHVSLLRGAGRRRRGTSGRARQAWQHLIGKGHPLLTSNYVLVETLALLQSRLGMQAVREFDDAVYPLLRVLWVDEETNRQAVSAVLATGRRRLSLVDCSSFVLTRHGLDTAFAFDDHFPEQGFDIVS